MPGTTSANPLLRRILLAIAIIFILVLTVIAIVIVHTAERLDIPLPASLKAATLASPILQLIGLLSTLPIAKNSKMLSRLFSILTFLTFAIDIGLITAGGTRLDETLLDCALSTQWKEWYVAKNAGPVRQIQDALTCCGLRSAHDMAWPFPDRTHDTTACEAAYGLRQSCLTLWQGQARGVLAGFVGIGTAGIIFKVLVLLLALSLRILVVVVPQTGNSNTTFGAQAVAGQTHPSRNLLTSGNDEQEESEPSLGATAPSDWYED